MNLCVLLLVGCLTYTTAASFPSITDITANTTLQNLTSTSAQTQSSNSAAEDEIWVWYCANNQRWSLPELKHDDCLGVLDYFWIETTDETARKSKEFRVPGARKKTTAPPQKTPQKYTFGTCTLAIVMVADFPNATSLPGGYKTGPPCETSTYYNLWKVAGNVVQRCVIDRGAVGWQPTGFHYGIGVFIWATGSLEDELIEADEPRFTFPTLGANANGSVANV